MMAKAQYVARKILLPTQDNPATACSILQQLDAVKSVRELAKNTAIEVEYDQCQTSYASLLALLNEQGVEVKGGWMSKLRAQWYDYIDTTARENAAAPPAACCNKPPRKL